MKYYSATKLKRLLSVAGHKDYYLSFEDLTYLRDVERLFYRVNVPEDFTKMINRIKGKSLRVLPNIYNDIQFVIEKAEKVLINKL